LNKLIKYVALSMIILLAANSAYAVSGQPHDLNALDVNGVKHANKGEDFNISILAAATADVNSDFNYMIALRYQDTYVDLNVNSYAGTFDGRTLTASASNGAVIDANTMSLTLSGSGPCNGAGDVNILVLDKEVSDLNTFDITVTIPTTGDITTLVGKEVSVELWAVQNTAVNTGTCLRMDGNAPFIVGPAIIVRTPNISNNVAKVNQSIAVMGFGFAPTTPTAIDKNVTIWFQDANGTGITTTTRLGDLNIIDTNHGAIKKYHKGNVGDANDAAQMGWDTTPVIWSSITDTNGTTVHPDTNGEFDINITVPFVSAGSIGLADLNILRVTSVTDGDINAINLAIAPNLTVPSDLNITITIGGNYYTIEEAITQNAVSNWAAVPNVIMRMGGYVDINAVDIVDHKYEIVVKFNSDMNFMTGPKRDYADMNSSAQGAGRVEINTTKIAELNMDANVFMYNVKVPSLAMPTIIKDGIGCTAATCKNIDGTVLSSSFTDTVSGTSTWVFNSSAMDGNLAFRVNSFSEYQAGTLTASMVTPNGGEKIRAQRNMVDANYTIQFTFSDTNTMDNNWVAMAGGSPMQAIIYYSTASGSRTGIIFRDVNIFDNSGVRCNGWNENMVFGTERTLMDESVSLSTTKTCNFDMNRADLNRIVGEFVVDVNIIDPWGSNVLASSDANIIFNPPLIEITDFNLSTNENFIINDYIDAIDNNNGVFDINYVIDFNIYLPDTNSDQNFTLADYNIHFYLGSTQNSLEHDLNIGGAAWKTLDQNFAPTAGKDGIDWIASGYGNDQAGMYMSCTSPPTGGAFMDYNCSAQFDTNHVIEGRYYLVAKIFNNKTRTVNNETPNHVGGAEQVVLHTLDTNELWDINSSIYAFSVNDNNVPRASIALSTVSTTQAAYTVTLVCDDNTSGISNYRFRDGLEGTWIDNNTTSTYTFSRGATVPVNKTYYGSCRDYAGNNSDINASMIVKFTVGTGGNGGNGGGGGGGGGGVPPTPGEETTEVIFEKLLSNKPTGEQIRERLMAVGASENAIEKASAAVGKTTVSRRVELIKITDTQGMVTYRTRVTIRIMNPGSKKMGSVKVIENLPKAVANSALDVNSGEIFEILQDDPVIRFTLDEILPGGTAEITYFVTRKISDITAENWDTPPIVSDMIETGVCAGVTCPSEACKSGWCNPTNGQCELKVKPDGTSCGTNKECSAGTCVDKAPVVPAEVCGNGVCGAGETYSNCPSDCEAPPMDMTVPTILVIIVLAGVGGYLYYTKYYIQK